MRTICLFACASVVMLSIAEAAQDPPAAAQSAVRARGVEAAQLLAAALEVSSSVRRLVANLDSSDLIVYLDVMPPRVDWAGKFRASTRLMGSGHGHRFARIWVDGSRGTGNGVALLAHELQHAVELANAPWVTTQERMLELFSHIGREHRTNHFETEAAVDVEARARGELARHRARTRAASRPGAR